jgi:hypothetical protein
VPRYISRLIKYFLVTGSGNSNEALLQFTLSITKGSLLLNTFTQHFRQNSVSRYTRPLFGSFLCAALLLSACNDHTKHITRTVQPAFYYWKSIFQLSAYEKARMDSLKIDTLYVKFFDVDWDEATRQPVPKAVISFKEKPGFAIIPTVFITNESLQQMDSLKTGWLAGKIVSLVKGILAKDSLAAPTELQIDCDWSVSTKEKYFSLLKQVKLLMPATKLSATIRLYQTKYYDRAGVPPVDKGLLMCYNMGNLKDIAAVNSIIETAELKKYIGNLGDYPLPLDVALPIFSWKVWFSKGVYNGIIRDLPDTLLNNKTFTKNNNSFTVQSDTLLAGYNFKRGDVIRLEKSDVNTVLQAAAMVSSKLKNTRCRVSLYHLDAVLLSKYSTNELESIFNSLR